MSDITRRGFLAATAFTASSYSRILGANERMRIGAIGCGSQGSEHLRELVKMRESDNLDVVAICDVYTKRADAAAQLTGGKIVKDYRKLIEDPGVDYVLIATPEHWHYQMTMDTIDAGKHIYCEKPMTWSIDQARRVALKMKGAKVKMQVGVQGMSDDSYETAHKYIQDGALGKVVLAQIDYSRNHLKDFWVNRTDPDVRPGENLDWNAFLGPARKRPFDLDRFLGWRRYWDYSGGIASDLFVHRVTRMIKSLGLTFPDKVVGTGGKFQFVNSPAEIPDTLNILLDYPEGLTVQLISSMANDTKIPHLIRGNKATLEFNEGGFTITPQKLFANEVQPVTYKRSGDEEVNLHHRNLLNSIRKGEALKCDHMLGYYGVVATAMGNLSYRNRKYLRWDRARERVIGA